ncbi:MAG: glycosyltransferase family 4 protein [Myxococcota bacterium]
MVHCAVPDGLFEQATPIARETNTLVCVGRLTAQKGQLLLLDALRQVLDEGLDAKLVLAGDGEMRPEVERRIAGHRLEEHVEITGWIDAPEVARRLQAARAMVLPSFAEGLPVVIMEALALCRPVLSTYIAGIPELVVPGQSGWLVPAGNVEAIARAMREILETPTERLDEMGREGARAVHERHHLPTEVSRLEKIFREYVRS